jgi:hypothetical protein
MVKQCKTLKCVAFKNDDEKGGAMKKCIEKCPPNNIVFHINHPKNGRSWCYTTPDNLLHLLTKNNYIYEVLTQYPLKVYFDYDLSGVEPQAVTLDQIKQIIEKYFPNAQYAISGSITEYKISYHIILTNYILYNKDDLLILKHIVTYIHNTEDTSFDHTVYTKNRNMKAINQSKPDERIQEIIENIDYKSHLITCFHLPNSLPLTELPLETKDAVLHEQTKYTFNLGELPRLNLSCPYDIDTSTITPIQILHMLPNTRECTFNYRHIVCRYAYNHKLTFQQFFEWILKKYNNLYVDQDAKIKQWIHHWDKVSTFEVVSHERIIKILAWFYPNIGKDLHLRRFQEQFTLDTNKIVKVDTLSQPVFNIEETSLILNTGLGSGKTHQTIEYLKTQPNFLWITPNIALAQNTLYRMETNDIPVVYYQNFTKKDKHLMLQFDKIIICLNSLHYLEKYKNDIIIIDEIETLLNKFEGNFMGINKSLVWNTFIKLLLNARQIILLDAFITKKTTDLLDKLNISYKIIERIHEPSTRHIHFNKHEPTVFHEIINRLQNGEKLLIFYPYKSVSKTHSSIDSLVKMLSDKTGKRGLGYHGDTSDKIKKTLKKVNEIWINYDFIIANNVITCGLNYEQLDYSGIYMFTASFNLPRDMIQFSYRLRFLQSNIIKVCFLSSPYSNTYENDCIIMKDPTYTSLYKNIITEYQSPNRDTFKLFCNKAKYIPVIDEIKISESIVKSITTLLEEYKISMHYADIPDSTIGDAEYIKEKCILFSATMMDKYQLAKYYFQKQFKPEVESELLEEIWDNKYIFFFNKLRNILTDPNNIFTKIALYNKFPIFFPTNIETVKLTTEIIDLIFEQFSFKYINRESSHKKILKEIYNLYFGKRIISTEKDINKNITYCIDENIDEYYEVARNFLILDYETKHTYSDVIYQETKELVNDEIEHLDF